MKDYDKELIIIKNKFYLANKYSWYFNIFTIVTMLIFIVLNFKSHNPNISGIIVGILAFIVIAKKHFKEMSKKIHISIFIMIVSKKSILQAI